MINQLISNQTIGLIDSDVVGLLQSIYEIQHSDGIIDEIKSISKSHDHLSFKYVPSEFNNEYTVIFDGSFDHLMNEWYYHLKIYNKDKLIIDHHQTASERVSSWIAIIASHLDQCRAFTDSDVLARVLNWNFEQPTYVYFKQERDSSGVMVTIDTLKNATKPEDIIPVKIDKEGYQYKVDDNPSLEIKTKIYNWCISRNSKYHLLNRRLAEAIGDCIVIERIREDRNNCNLKKDL